MTIEKQNHTSPEKGRFKTIDGMRGLAALSVVIYHMSGNLQLELSRLLPDELLAAFSYGFLGVPVFFVISGFVISHSIGNSLITAKYTGNFILRRSIRLDLVYWMAILFSICLMLVKARYFEVDGSVPSGFNIFMHMFYLQDVFSIEPKISVVYWTLCLEVQFYLFYIMTIWSSQAISTRFSFSNYAIQVGVMTTVGLLSIIVDYQIMSISIPGLFVQYWHYFLIGVLVSNVVRGRANAYKLLLFWLVVEVAFQLGVEVKAYAVTAILTGAFIVGVWQSCGFDKYLTNSLFQYLGRISYTLYLLHPDIGWKFISLSKHFLGDNISFMFTGIIFIFSILVSIIVAHIFHVLFEVPSLKLASKLKKQKIDFAVVKQSQIISDNKYK